MGTLKQIKANIDGQILTLNALTIITATCSTAAATVAKAIALDDANYTPQAGDLFAVTFTLGTSAASPTLNINGSGAKNIRLGTTNASATTFTLGANATVLLYFDGTYYQMTGSYRTTDSDNFDRMYHNVAKTMGETLYRYKLILEGLDGKYYPLTTTDQTTATLVQKAPTTATLKIGGNIYYYNTTTTVNANATVSNTYSELSQTTMVYNFNQDAGYTLQQPIYLVGIPQTGGGFILDDTYYTQTLPTSEDNKIYIQLGIVYAQNRLRLEIENPIYEFKNGMLRNYIPEHTHNYTIPTKTSDLTNDSDFQTANQVSTAISNLVNSAPATLDTLKELADALGNDPAFATTVTNSIAGKVSKTGDESIAGLKTFSDGIVIPGSAKYIDIGNKTNWFWTRFSGENWTFNNTYTSGGWARNLMEMKNAAGDAYFRIGALGSSQAFTHMYIGPAYNDYWLSLNGTRADFKVKPIYNGVDLATKNDIPTSLPANGGNADTVSGFTVGVSVPANAKFTDTVYTHPTGQGNYHVPSESGARISDILMRSSGGTGTGRWASVKDAGLYNYVKTADTGAIAASNTLEVALSKLENNISGISVPTIATQAEAEAGTDNTMMMTPLRVKESILANATGGGGGSEVVFEGTVFRIGLWSDNPNYRMTNCDYLMKSNETLVLLLYATGLHPFSTLRIKTPMIDSPDWALGDEYVDISSRNIFSIASVDFGEISIYKFDTASPIMSNYNFDNQYGGVVEIKHPTSAASFKVVKLA